MTLAMTNPLRSNPPHRFAICPHDVVKDGAVPRYPLQPCALNTATHHLLHCGHTIRTNLPSSCGANCASVPATYAHVPRFACERCIEALLDAKMTQRYGGLESWVRLEYGHLGREEVWRQGMIHFYSQEENWRQERVETDAILRVGARHSEAAGEAAEWDGKVRVNVSEMTAAELAASKRAIREKKEKYAKKVHKAETIARGLDRLMGY
ncbi:hypothetical protein P152DRAFT_488858 [Eremomyces bilateralis CBS 781.70]|uniref:Uncharacterized protein n=1 Tax=Eremomyces bilateralis CBS 781.70 TaxID=1392243 RepID=A0A6G1G123_9PEZI|nr:uncharacterized protein P152DRAFT_488858 [Eremomyces bilateralis CBS 781.70]KAF1811754.1 hypothetical protein P152DRAFT_488858 [Eremomyces bilateralis CBS 781.70]